MRSRKGFLILAVLALISAAGRNGLFHIDRNHVGKLALGLPESQIYSLYPRLPKRKVDLRLEGDPTPAVEIYLSPHCHDPALTVRLTGPRNTVDEIEVNDHRFQNDAGIHVGSTFGQLRKVYGKLRLAVGEGQYCVFPEDAGLSFCLDLNSQNEMALDKTSGDLSKIPDGTPVKYILVFGKRSGIF
ncbi:MAG: hypothetical protein JO061_00100 [Acidobacteriaceae bacterium]|nr:hypothetical protein [Acidobacteriaceae bacterium]